MLRDYQNSALITQRAKQLYMVFAVALFSTFTVKASASDIVHINGNPGSYPVGTSISLQITCQGVPGERLMGCWLSWAYAGAASTEYTIQNHRFSSYSYSGAWTFSVVAWNFDPSQVNFFGDGEWEQDNVHTGALGFFTN